MVDMSKRIITRQCVTSEDVEVARRVAERQRQADSVFARAFAWFGTVVVVFGVAVFAYAFVIASYPSTPTADLGPLAFAPANRAGISATSTTSSNVPLLSSWRMAGMAARCIARTVIGLRC
jgi:hypothetical protein